MKTLYLIGGTMGVGKSAVCRTLKKRLPGAVMLDTTHLTPEQAAEAISQMKR